MQHNLTSLFLQYIRLDRKRSAEGLSAAEEELLERLNRFLSRTLNAQVPRGAERRRSIRVPAELGCRWAPVARPQDGTITSLSRVGAFIRTASPAPVGEEIAISIARPTGGALEVPGSVANQVLHPDPDKRGMGVRFGRLAPAERDEVDELYRLSIVRQFGKPEEPDESLDRPEL